MRDRRAPRAALLLLVAAVASGVGLPLSCGVPGPVTTSAGNGGAGGSSSHAGSSHAAGSSGHAAGTGTGGTSTTTGTGGVPATTATAGTGGASSTTTGGTGGASSSATGGTSGASTTASSGAGGSGGAPETTVTLHPNAPPLPGESACTVVEVTNIPEPDFTHLALCTPITYATNPPSGGNHWPEWAEYTEYTYPIPREMSVHDLEHGAIVLSYKCAGSCPDVVAALNMVFANEVDPLCLASGPGPLGRMVLTPDPLLDTPIAAAAWGATYTATCIDLPSLQAFANAHYGQGREDFCTNGWDPQSVVCTDGGADGG